MKIITHSDNDGKLSGFWCWYYENYMHYKDPENYEKPDPTDIIIGNYKDSDNEYLEELIEQYIAEGERIYIVDYSIPRELMDRLVELNCNITWIDHHESAIRRYYGYRNMDKLHFYLRSGIAACELTFVYLFYGKDNPNFDYDHLEISKLPKFTLLIGDQDVWEFKYGDDTKNFNVYVNGQNSASAIGRLWLYLLDVYDYSVHPSEIDYNSRVINERLQKCIETGKMLTEIGNEIKSDYALNNRKEVEFEGYTCAYLYIPDSGNSNDLNYVDEFGMEHFALEEYPIGIIHRRFGPDYQYTLYSSNEDVNCSELAEKYGGGGHKGAAGFSLNHPLF